MKIERLHYTDQVLELLKVSRDTIGILSLRTLWAGLGFLSSLLIARLYGASAAGSFYLALAIVTVFVTIGQLGMDLPLMRMMSVANDRRDTSSVDALMKKASLLAFTAALFFTVLVIATSTPVGRLLSDETLPEMLRIMALAIIPYTLLLLTARAFMSIKRPALAETVHRIGFQIAFIALVVALTSRQNGIGLAIAFTASYWLLYSLARWKWRDARSSNSSPKVTTSASVLLRPGLPILFAATIQLVIDWSDTLMIGYFMTPESVGVYGTALRASLIITLILGAATPVFGPRFAALYKRAATTQLTSLTRWVASGCALLSVPLLIVFLVFSDPLMALFGEEFRSGSTVLMVLAIGQYAHVASGLVGLLLAMTGHEKRLLQATAFSAIANVTLNLALIPRFGIEGAALATTASLILTNSLNLYLVKRELGFLAVGIPKPSVHT